MTRKKIDFDELEKLLPRRELFADSKDGFNAYCVFSEAAAAYLELARGKHPELVIVPMEPTEEMFKAMFQNGKFVINGGWIFPGTQVTLPIYKAAIKSAPGVGEG